MINNKIYEHSPFAEIVSQEHSSRFRLYTYAYAYPQEIKGYDADWQRNFVQLSIPGIKVEIDEVMFEGQLLNYYIKELQSFSLLQKQLVCFEPTESIFSLSFSFNNIKKIVVVGNINYPLGTGANLDYEFETDLTYLDKFIQGLKNINIHFPSRR